MYLPKIRRVWIFPDGMEMLHLLAQMRIAFDAKTCDEADHQRVGLAECVAFAAAYGGDEGGHRISGSARLDAQRLDHLAPFFRFVGEEFGESGGRARKD